MFWNVQTLKEAPNLKFFGISEFFGIHLNEVKELVNSLFLGKKYGPYYRESSAFTLFRIIALFLPGLGPGLIDHCIANYHDALRLGNPMPLVPNPSL
jgi:hypothetical protein